MIAELSDLEILYFRKKMYVEVRKLPNFVDQSEEYFMPEKQDFDEVRFKVISSIAYFLWEKAGKPQNRDTEIWKEAEYVWEFIRYMW
jgi:hypothetical protein